jgi:hypothetical protein
MEVAAGEVFEPPGAPVFSVATCSVAPRAATSCSRHAVRRLTRNPVWRDPLAFFTTIRRAPRSARAIAARRRAADRGRFDSAP